MFNPMTYVGMARLAVIAAKVITGRKLHRRPVAVTACYDTAASGASGATVSGFDG